jgi:hypothetical protein
MWRFKKRRRTAMLTESFWQFFGLVNVAGCLWLIISIAVASFIGNIIHFGNPSDEE